MQCSWLRQWTKMWKGNHTTVWRHLGPILKAIEFQTDHFGFAQPFNKKKTKPTHNNNYIIYISENNC